MLTILDSPCEVTYYALFMIMSATVVMLVAYLSLPIFLLE
jgi:hypothetical protein